MSFLTDYSLFLTKTATVVIAIGVLLLIFAALKAKSKEQEKGFLSVKKLNDKFDDMIETVNDHILSKEDKKSLKKTKKTEKKSKKAGKSKKSSGKTPSKKRLFVLDFNGDIRASAVSALREEITAIILTAKPKDHVMLRLESAGGVVNGYGLAASELQRLRDAKLHLTVSVDKVAASGGYMMACVANEIIAAPFAIIGSIGVIAQLPNLNKWLNKHNIEFEQVMAGEYKRTLTVFGKNTSAGRAKMQNEIDETHELFKSFIKTHRKQVDIETVATGEHWLASQTIEKKLVDKLQTSDDFLVSQKDQFDLYKIQYKIKQPFGKRCSNSMHNMLHQVFSANAQTGQDYL